MDYIEIFGNLRSNQKWGRKSPHKAVLMFTVIELLEQNVLSENEIFYDDNLKSVFLKVWNRIFPDAPLLHSEAYLPFWWLQSDSFWHIVPYSGKEDILSLMRDENIKPSEAKLIDSVKYAELDEDLYFLMTLPSGRSSLKRILLETYTTLSERQIDRLAESADNTIDYSASALSEYNKILSNDKYEKDEETTINVGIDEELVGQFRNLNEDVQLVLNIQYYTFLKNHRGERVMFKELFPSVYDLFDKIVNHPLDRSNFATSFVFTYDNFLSDLKIALMSEDGSMELIEKIGAVLDMLRGNVNNKEVPETLVDSKYIELPANDIEKISYADEDVASSTELTIVNKLNSCCIIDNQGENLFSSSGQLIKLDDVFYRVNYSGSIVSMNIIQVDSKDLFFLGRRILSAHNHSPLLSGLDEKNYLKQIKAVKYDPDCDEYYIQVDNRWYGSSGYYADLTDRIITQSSNTASSSEAKIDSIDNQESSAQINLSDDTEIEHVFLDSKGEVLYTVTSSADYTPEKDKKTDDRKGKTWTPDEEEKIAFYYSRGIDFASIAERMGRTEIAIKARLAKLGLIEYTYEKDEEAISLNNEDNEPNKLNKGDFTIENTIVRCSIFDKHGNRVFSSRGKLKYINGNLYRLNLKEDRFTLKSMLFENGIWVKGKSKIIAPSSTKLYKVLDNSLDYCEAVEDIDDHTYFKDCRLKVGGEWYCSDGNLYVPQTDTNEIEKIEKEEEGKEESYSQFSVKIGDVIQVFPSQLVGEVVKLRIDKTGHRKIIVQSSDGPRVEVYDSPYLYKMVPEKKKGLTKPQSAKRERIKRDYVKEIVTDVDLGQRRKVNASIGDWIQWKPTEEVGKVIAFRDDESVRKMLVRKKNGYEIEIPDNPNDYDIMLNGPKLNTANPTPPNQVAVVDSSEGKTNKPSGVRIGDWIKIKNYNTSCKVIKIDKFASAFTKLIVEFKDGRQDWIINNPDLYTIE